MRKIVTLFAFLLFFAADNFAQYIPKVPVIYADTITRKHPWRAASLVVGTNLFVWSIDRFIAKTPYSEISGSTIKANFKKGFVWDNDMFVTNLFMHPYHGSLYFNAARANGMNFWQSVPFAFGGSLMWEMCMENEYPSINDIFSTTCGGMALGEITHRLSTSIVDESAHGWSRFGSELAGLVLTPTAGLTRIINGDMFRTKPRGYRNNYQTIPLQISLGLGSAYNASTNNIFRGVTSGTIDLALEYNDPFELDEVKPYDYFKLNTTLKLFSNQPVVSRFNAQALLWGENFTPYKNHKMLVGVFQHFDYFDSDTLMKGGTYLPYKLSASASFGAGLLYSFNNDIKTITAEMGLHLNAVLMGGNATDYYNFQNRNYSLGSGWSSKMFTQIRFSNVGSFYLGIDYFHLFTWDGYSPDQSATAVHNEHEYNSQGDKGNSVLVVLNPRMELYINKQLSCNVDIFAHVRNSYYFFHPDVRTKSNEFKLSVVYKY